MWNRYKSNKYGNRKIQFDGQTFDSKREMRHYTELLLLEKAGKIKDLQRQVKFQLIPAQREPDIIGPKGGHKPGKLIERELDYIADFVYTDVSTGQMVVEDIKGYKATNAPAYSKFAIKRKLMLYFHGIRIKEV